MHRRFLLGLFVVSSFATPVAVAQPIPVEVVRTDEGAWQLLRGGEPWVIRGAGGSASKEKLAAAGANTFRTWGVDDDLGEQLDEAHRLGLAVVVGHWLGHPRHGFDYNDLDQVAAQVSQVWRAVKRYKDHPAVLMWGIGNEAEGFGDGDDAAYWSHVQAVAAMVKELDPNHPTMVVTADIGGRRVDAIHRLCPAIDVVGINTYGGLPSLPRRYREAGGTKPIVITEFGPPGTWETPRNAFGVPRELTSTQKGVVYRDAFTQGCLDAGDLCLGGFAFLWGHKMEATATWFGMFLPTGEKLAAVDAMTEIWTGSPPANRCPEIRSLTVHGADVVSPGEIVEVALDAADPEGADLTVEWTLRVESAVYETGGDAQALPYVVNDVITSSSTTGATLTMPGGGLYRLYVVVRDGDGGAATANVPLKVDGPVEPFAIRFPLGVYADDAPVLWHPSGWMGEYKSLSMDAECTENPRSGPSCLRFDYEDPGNWVGVVWQDPPMDWGEKPGGHDLTGARRLVFWARGAEGGETIDFGVGILGADKPYPDSLRAEAKDIELTTVWTRYEIDLAGKDLSVVKTPFWFALEGHGGPITFYLDDIRFE